ncbi:MAG: hypothetical protein N2C12_15070 [Planctomycetales bacterium]
MVEAGGKLSRDMLVLLGASNLARGISTVVGTAQQLRPGPLDIYTAIGHGRSYGQPSCVLGRCLPGILQSDLWDALSQVRCDRVLALVTDLGNDLMYGVPVSLIMEWLQECLKRLADLDAQIVITSLPMVTLNQLTPRRYHIFRNLLFPNNKTDLETALSLAEKLDREIRNLCEPNRLHLITPCPDWYGFDPIHLKMACWRQAWPMIMAPWKIRPSIDLQPRRSIARWLYLRTRVPAKRQLLGYQQTKNQPSARLLDGTTVASY